MTDAISIQHVNLMVDDLALADAFYAGLLGLERDSTPDLGFPAQFYRVGETQQIHVNELPDVHAQRAHFCLRVDDFNGLFARARAQGVVDTATWGAVRRLPSGVVQAFLRDPSGNLIEISCEADQPVDDAVFEPDDGDRAAPSVPRPS